MMDGIILAALALLSVPVLLIVILVKVCGLENKVTDLALKLTVIDFTQRHRDTESVASRRGAEAQRGLTNLCASVPLCETPKTPYEPTAVDLFWMRIEDWLAVRGDFAPKGMTHEFAFATRWLVRIAACDAGARRHLRARWRPPHRRRIPLHEVQGKV